MKPIKNKSIEHLSAQRVESSTVRLAEKFLELIEDKFMNGVTSDIHQKHQLLRDEIISDDGIFSEKFSVRERLELAKLCDKM